MAINAPIIKPDPVGSLLESFKVADTSARDYARLQIERQRMAEEAVQRARENKARDFKLMLDAVGRQDDLKQKAIENEFRRDQLGINMYAARTARTNADAMRGYRQEQLGIAQDRADTSRMTAEQLAAHREQQLEISRMNAESLSAYRLRQQKEQSGDPLDLAEGRTPYLGGGGTPSALPLPEAPTVGVDAVPPPLTDAGMDSFRQDWVPPDTTGVPVTPDAPRSELYPPGMVPGEGVLPADPAEAADPLVGEDPPPGFQAPDAGAEGVGGPTGAPAPAAAEPPALSSAPAAVEPVGGGLRPPPRLQTPSFAEVELSQDSHNTILGLYVTNTALTERSKQSAAWAAKIAASMPKASEANKPIYQARYGEALRAAQTDAVAANAASVKAKRLEAQAKVTEKRQAEIAALAHLDGVLPETDRAALIAEASSPQAGGNADRKITVLKAYDQVRQARMLNHPSNGIKTAEMVARHGLALETAGAQKAREDAILAKSYRKKLANLGPVPEDDEEKTSYVSRKNRLEDKLMELEVGEGRWEDLNDSFQAAVEADTQKDPLDKTGGATPAPAPVETPAPAAASATGQGFLQQQPTAPPDPKKEASNKFWSEGKTQAAALANMDGGKDAQGNVIPPMSREELEAIANKKAPVRYMDYSDEGVPLPQLGEPYVTTLAKKLGDRFQSPVGDRDARGRGGKVSTEDFLVEAAKDRLARMKATAVSKLPAEAKAQVDAIREKYKLTK